MKIEILEPAKEDLVAGYQFYEEQATGIGSYFLESLFADIDALPKYAGTHRVVHGYHRCLASRFPYAIYYRVENSAVRVRAVVDCRRKPSRIRRHLRDQ